MVLEVETGNSCAFVFADRAPDIDDIAVAGIGVGNHRNGRGAADVAQVLYHLRLGNEAYIRIAVPCCSSEAGNINGIEAGLFDCLGK